MIAKTQFYGTAAALLIALAAVPANGAEVSYSGSLQYAAGDYYFNANTSSLSLLNGFSLSAGVFYASVSVPLIYQSTPWISFGGVGMIPSGGTQHEQVGKGGMHDRDWLLPDTSQYEHMGIGDPLLHADVKVIEELGLRPAVFLAGETKPPLADPQSGFGTGEWDFGVGGSLAKVFGQTFIFVDLTYWFLGDMPDLDFMDPLAYGISLGWSLADGDYGVMASFSGYSRIIAGVSPPMQIGLAVNRRLAPGSGLTGGLSFGLTESAPDVSLSLGWQIGL